jgi:hypothetical protein
VCPFSPALKFATGNSIAADIKQPSDTPEEPPSPPEEKREQQLAIGEE